MLLLPALGGLGREHAAAAEAGDAEIVGADDAGGLGETGGGDLVAPGRDGGDAVAEAGVDHLREGRAVAQGGEVDGELGGGHRWIAGG